MKRFIPILGLLGISFLSTGAFATTAASASTAASTKPTTAQRKEALDACKKEGKVGKQLDECLKEKLSQNSRSNTTAGH